jgi:glycerol-3-phosphate acyltransferase PlsX
MIRIAIDVMGGDSGISVTIPASILALSTNSNLHLTLVGDASKIEARLKRSKFDMYSRINIIHSDEIVEMDELPQHALRYKKNSSMRKAIDLVKSKNVSAMVSAGNTGALMATAKFVLKTMPGIDRPAIITVLPTSTGKTRVMDLGANVDATEHNLFQFAVMGSALIEAVEEKKKPIVKLLNIGKEAIKGRDEIKKAALLFESCQIFEYGGFVEADSLFSGQQDLIVCDGFAGNIALKTSEGLAKLLMRSLRQAFNKNMLTKCIGLLAYPILKSLRSQMDPAKYNGATLLGLNGIVIKSHGATSVKGFESAIQQAYIQSKKEVCLLVNQKLNDYINQGVLSCPIL